MKLKNLDLWNASAAPKLQKKGVSWQSMSWVCSRWLEDQINSEFRCYSHDLILSYFFSSSCLCLICLGKERLHEFIKLILPFDISLVLWWRTKNFMCFTVFFCSKILWIYWIIYFFIIFVAHSKIFKLSVSIFKIFTFTWNKLYCDVFWWGFVYYNYKDFWLSLLYPLDESDWFNIDSWPYFPQ